MELVMRLWGIRSGGTEEEVWIYHQPSCCLGKSGPWVSRGCLLGLGAGTKQQVRGVRLEEEGVWQPQEIYAGKKENYNQYSIRAECYG